jgi:hypothetical protein
MFEQPQKVRILPMNITWYSKEALRLIITRSRASWSTQIPGVSSVLQKAITHPNFQNSIFQLLRVFLERTRRATLVDSPIFSYSPLSALYCTGDSLHSEEHIARCNKHGESAGCSNCGVQIWYQHNFQGNQAVRLKRYK